MRARSSYLRSCQGSGRRTRHHCRLCPWLCCVLYVTFHIPVIELTQQAMLSELLSANLCTPFILKMVEGM